MNLKTSPIKLASLMELKKKEQSRPSGIKEGIRIEKGFTVSEAYLEKIRPLLEKYVDFYSTYPDIFVDEILTPQESGFSLYFFQRIFLRACMRYKYVYATAPRAFSKTFLSVLALILNCIFRPGLNVFMVSPTKEQAAKVCAQKVREILNLFPILRGELIGGDGHFSKDYVTLKFRNGSLMDVVGALDSTRGIRRNAGLIDEVRRGRKFIINLIGKTEAFWNSLWWRRSLHFL